jgi:hypothetical protein
MSEQISFFDGRQVSNIRFFIGMDQEKDFVFTENGLDWPVAEGKTWELLIKRYPGDKKNILRLTLNNGLTIPVYDTNILRSRLTAEQAQIQEGQYFFMLNRTDVRKPYINAWCTFSFGPQDSQ